MNEDQNSMRKGNVNSRWDLLKAPGNKVFNYDFAKDMETLSLKK